MVGLHYTRFLAGHDYKHNTSFAAELKICQIRHFREMRSAILISVASYFAIGILLLVCLSRYAGAWFGSAMALMALLLMISPPLTELRQRAYLGRRGESDCVRFPVPHFRETTARFRPGSAARVHFLPYGFRGAGGAHDTSLLDGTANRGLESECSGVGLRLFGPSEFSTRLVSVLAYTGMSFFSTASSGDIQTFSRDWSS